MPLRQFVVVAIISLAGASSAWASERAPDVESPGKDITELDTITVTASRRERPLREVANSISIIDAERIEETLARDIKDLARDAPWLSVPNDPSRFGLAGFTIRGIGGNRVAAEIDGVPVASGFAVGSYSSSRRNAVNPALLKRVEILRGPASALYGSDAIGGLVSYSTYTPEDLLATKDASSHLSAGMSYDGRDDSMAGTLLGASQWDEHSGLIALTRRDGHESDNTASLPEAAPNPRDYNETDLAVRWLHASERGTIGLNLDLRSSHVRTRVDNLEGQGRFASTEILNGEDRQTSHRVAVHGRRRLDSALGDDLDWRLFFQQTHTDQRSFEQRTASRRSPAATQRFPSFLFSELGRGLDLSVSRDLPGTTASHRLLYGLQLRSTRIDESRDNLLINLDTGEQSSTVLGETFPVRDFPVSQINEAALFAHDEIAFADERVLIIPGLRIEYYDLDPRTDPVYTEDNPTSEPVAISELSLVPKLGAVWRADESWSLFAQYARGFRSPPFEDANIGLEIPLFNIRAIPNPDLRPETSDSFEAGVRMAGRRLQGSLSLYSNHYDDFIDSKVNLGPDPESGVLIFQSLNRERARIRGLEFNLTTDLGNLLPGMEIRASFSRARGDDTIRDLPLNSVDPDRAVVAVRYDDPASRWGAELNARLARAKTRVDDSTSELFRPPGYGVLDLFAYVQLRPNARLNFSVHNLADRQYWDWADVRGRPADDPLIGLYSATGLNFSAAIKLDW